MSMSPERKFIHLHVHSAYSLAEGAIRVKDLIKTSRAQNIPAMAVTDTNNMFGALEFSLAAVDAGIQPILGVQVGLGHEAHELVLIAQSETGYRNLSRLISDAYMQSGDKGEPIISWEWLENCHEGVICLTGGLRGLIAQYVLHNQDKEAEKALKKLKAIFADRLYMELQRHGLAEQERIEPSLVSLADKHEVALVATNDAYFLTPDMHQAHDALLCIAQGRYINEDDRRKVTPHHYLKSESEMTALFADLPDAVANTVEIAKRCHFLLGRKDPILPPFEGEQGRDEVEELRHQSKLGLQWRLENFVENFDDKDVAQAYWDRLDFELNTIIQMGFPGYFLIVADFIQWAKDHDIPVGPGRGSGAGSVVAWALKITDLDPLKFNLLFERFLNPERVSMPDFDVDFCQDRRDEVIRYVQEKYGYDRVAQIITFGTLQARAVVRDVGRVLQLPYGQVDRIAKLIPSNPANPITLQEALDQDPDLRREMNAEETTATLINIALKLEGLFRHASTHAAGVVIGDRPLHELVPLYRDPRSDMPVTQFNMKYVEQAGLVKFDFLGLKTLTVIQEAVRLVKETTGEEIDILKIPFEDDKTYEMLARGETTGVFQLESAGMRDLGKQMKIENFAQIIALVALFRPGPMENIPKYLACLHGREERDYMHPLLTEVLEETYGIMIYQEQVMQAAQLLAGYTLGGADLLRRAMGKKIQAEMDAQREMFVTGAAKHHQVPEQQANHIFDQIAKFAGYGFNKAHSAGYALVSYWTAWLKANYPVQFMAATMTLDLGNTDKLAILKQEVERLDIPVYGPDVNRSLPVFKVEGEGIRYALAALKGVGEAAMESLVKTREAGSYQDVYDFAERVEPQSMNKKQIEMLASAGAFESLGMNRASVYEMAETVLRYGQMIAADRDSGQDSLFGGLEDQSQNRPPVPKLSEWEPLEKLRHEFEAVGFYLSAHPLDARRALLEKSGVVLHADLPARLEHSTGARLSMAGVVIRKQERISAKTGNKFAFLTLSDPSGVYEGMVFSDVLAASRTVMEVGASVMAVVDAELREDQLRLTIQSLTPLEESLQNKRRNVTIHAETVEGVGGVQASLSGVGQGGVKVVLSVPANGGTHRAQFVLPGRYDLDSRLIGTISTIDGIGDVVEG